MPDCLIGLGSNVGDRPANLRQAVKLLVETPGIAVDAVSRWYATAPIGGPAGQGEFFNGALRLRTELPPEKLLVELQRIENQLGRERGIRWDARTLDLDLLLYGEKIIDSPNLVVPHPRMALRRFVLAPAAEIAGEMLHPELGRSVRQLLKHAKRCKSEVVVLGWPEEDNGLLAVKVAFGVGIAEIKLEELNQTSSGIDPSRGTRSGQRFRSAIEFSVESLCSCPAADHPIVRDLRQPPEWIVGPEIFPQSGPLKVLVVPLDWNEREWLKGARVIFDKRQQELALNPPETPEPEDLAPEWETESEWNPETESEWSPERESAVADEWELESEDMNELGWEENELFSEENDGDLNKTIEELILGVPILRVSAGELSAQCKEIVAVLMGM